MAVSKHRLNARAEESPAPATTPTMPATPAPPALPAVPAAPTLPEVPETASAALPPPPSPPQFPPLAALPPGEGGSGQGPEWPTKRPSIVWGLLAYLNSRDRIWASVHRSRRPRRSWLWMFAAGLWVGQGGLIETLLRHVT